MNYQRPQNLAKTNQSSGKLNQLEIPIVKVLSILITGLKKVERFFPIIGLIGVFVGLAIQIYPQIDWSTIHLEPSLDLVGSGIFVMSGFINLLIKYLHEHNRKKMGSEKIEPPINFNINDYIDREEIEKDFQSEKFDCAFVNNKNLCDQQLRNGQLREIYNTRIEELTNLAEEAFPRGEGEGKVSYAKSRDERRDAFRVWTRFNSETAQIIYYNGEVIGMSLMLRLSKDT